MLIHSNIKTNTTLLKLVNENVYGVFQSTLRVFELLKKKNIANTRTVK